MQKFNWDQEFPVTEFVHFTYKEILSNVYEPTNIIDKINKQLSHRNYYEYYKPINTVKKLFGRDETLRTCKRYIDSKQPFGIFGMRRSGKTSILLTLKQAFNYPENFNIQLIRCEDGEDSNLLATAFFKKIVFDTLKESDLTIEQSSEITAKVDSAAFQKWTLEEDWEVISDALQLLLNYSKQTVVWMFDEIENISGVSEDNNLWTTDVYYTFFQKISRFLEHIPNFLIVISGTNPALLEEQMWRKTSQSKGTINPLAGRFGIEYIGPLALSDYKHMIESLGKPSGIIYEEGSISVLFDYFWGFPFPTRKFLSGMLKSEIGRTERPLRIKPSMIRDELNNQKLDIVNYFRPSIDNLHILYREEYEVLVQLSEDNEYQELYFSEFASNRSMFKVKEHLTKYGILKIENHSVKLMPAISDVLKSYRPPSSLSRDVPVDNSIDETTSSTRRRLAKDLIDRFEEDLSYFLSLQSRFIWADLHDVKGIVKEKIHPRDEKRIARIGSVASHDGAIGVLTFSEKGDLVRTKKFWESFGKIWKLDSKQEFTKLFDSLNELRNISHHVDNAIESEMKESDIERLYSLMQKLHYPLASFSRK